MRDLVLHGDHVSPRAEALLFAADKAHHVETLDPAGADRGDVVITDRYTRLLGRLPGRRPRPRAPRGPRPAMWAVGGLLPTSRSCSTSPPPTGAGARGDVHDRLESEPDDFHEAIRQHFLDLAAARPRSATSSSTADGTREDIHAAVSRSGSPALWSDGP